MTTKPPVEAKVYAATIGTGAGAVTSGFVVWLLGVLIWHAPFTAAGATVAVASVPGPVTGVVGLVITVGGAFVGGYLAKHTPRPQPEVDPAPGLPDVAHAEHLLSPAARAEMSQLPDLHGEQPVDQRDLDGDGRDDATGRFV